MDIFEKQGQDLLRANAPLADRMRPRVLDEFIGQDHIIGPGRLLRRAIQIDQLSSVIFYGPPGTGKTTLARIIANTTKAQFISINAVLAGVKDIREAIESAKKTLSLYAKRTILFIDEVHRFNKAQQDALLPHVENGVLVLIGATTENPYFEVNKALVSRSRIFQLQVLTEENLVAVAKQALHDKERGYGNKKIKISDDALKHLVSVANGDARGVLNALELAVETTGPDKSGIIKINREVIEDSIQKRAVLYDKDGDAHYDTISAFIKSVRGSDPDAALYWMAKMLYAGEDPRFIFRRMIILASEDVGLADPKALSVVVSAAQAFDYIGLPEGRFPMAQACLYLATAPKSNSTLAFFDALKQVSQERDDDVPNHLKDASRDKEGFGHGDGYLYPHAYRDHWVAQQYLPHILMGKSFYTPSDQGYEQTIKESVVRRKEAQVAAMLEESAPDVYSARTQNNNDWEQRSSTNSGKRLGKIRDTMLDLATLNDGALVLDINARSGLLSFECLRRMPQGTVWSLAHSRDDFNALKDLVSQLPSLHRPLLLETSFKTIQKDLLTAAGSTVTFDAILGRHTLVQIEDKVKFVKCLTALLGKKGRLVLAEPLHRESLRLSHFLKLSPQNIQKRFEKAEEQFFNNQDNPAFNWTLENLAQEINAQLTLSPSVHRYSHLSKRKIKPHEVDGWLSSSGRKKGLTLGTVLSAIFNKKELSTLTKQIHAQFDNREIEWQSVEGFIVIANNA